MAEWTKADEARRTSLINQLSKLNDKMNAATAKEFKTGGKPITITTETLQSIVAFHGRLNERMDAVENRLEKMETIEPDECSHPNALLSDSIEPPTYYCPDCGETYIGAS